MKALFTLAALVAALLFTCGCSPSPKEEIVGHWTVDEKSLASKDSNSQNDSAKALATQMAKALASSMSIDFAKDGTFTMHVFMAISGTYRLDGRKVFMKFTSTPFGANNSVDSSKEQEADLSSDGKTLTLPSNSGNSDPLTLIKSPPQDGSSANGAATTDLPSKK